MRSSSEITVLVGYDVLSVLVNVDPKGTAGALCVNLDLEGDGQSNVFNCFAK
jgi:hypothetical protein